MKTSRVLPVVLGLSLIVAAATLGYWTGGLRPIRSASGIVLGRLPFGVEQSDLNLLLITLDTTRADRLGAYRYSEQTQNLDRLAREGVLFEQTTTVAPLTLPSHVSLFTGRFPPQHGIRTNGAFLPIAS